MFPTTAKNVSLTRFETKLIYYIIKSYKQRTAQYHPIKPNELFTLTSNRNHTAYHKLLEN